MARFRILVAAMFGLSILSAAGNAKAEDVLGFLDPTTGKFSPAQAAVSSTASASTHGTLSVSFTVTVASTNIAATTPISCSLTAYVYLNGGANGVIAETSSVAATRAGSTAKCLVKIPYSWSGYSPTDTVRLSYTINSGAESGQPTRMSNHTLSTINMPAAGATTSITVAATI
jgi:hypothetical protein